MLRLTLFSPTRCVCLTIYTSKWLFKNELNDEQLWISWGYSFFGSRYLRSALNVQFYPPPSEFSSHTLYVSLRSSPFVISYYQHHRYYYQHHRRYSYHYYHYPYHHHPTRNSNFSTSICPVPNGAMKVIGSSIHRYRKSGFEICANTERFFFPTRCVCQTIYL